jgi:hypothetical protein
VKSLDAEMQAAYQRGYREGQGGGGGLVSLITGLMIGAASVGMYWYLFG